MQPVVREIKDFGVVTVACNSRKWSNERDESYMSVSKDGSTVVRHRKVRSSVPVCEKGHPLGA